MNSKTLEQETKSLLTSVLISTPLKCTVNQLAKDYYEMVGNPIPYRELGYRNILEYLNAIPDTLIVKGANELAYVEPVYSEKSAHIDTLVSKQKMPRPKRTKSKKKTNKCQYPQKNYQQNHYNLPQTSSSHLYQTNSYYGSTKAESTDSGQFDEIHQHETFIDEIHNVSIKTQRNLRELIAYWPDGIYCTQLRSEYKKRFRTNLDFEKYGYRSLIEMCADLPLIFNFIQPNTEDYILYDCTKRTPQIVNFPKNVSLENSLTSNDLVTLDDLPKMSWDKTEYIVPDDVLHLHEKLERYSYFDEIKIRNLLVVYIGDIYDLSKFWIYLKDKGLDTMMAKIQDFFRETDKTKYSIPLCLIDVGLYCLAKYNGEYNRAMIVNKTYNSTKHFKVFYVDYGTIDVVSIENIYYLPRKFAKLPCQAIRCRLAYIYPPVKGAPWSCEAIERFKELQAGQMVVSVTDVDYKNHILEVFIADVLKKVYIQDILVKEKLALYMDQETRGGLQDPNLVCNVEHLFFYPDFADLEDGFGPTQSDLHYIHTNNISVNHYLKVYFENDDQEDVNGIENEYEHFLKSPMIASFDDTLIVGNGLFSKVDGEIYQLKLDPDTDGECALSENLTNTSVCSEDSSAQSQSTPSSGFTQNGKRARKLLQDNTLNNSDFDNTFLPEITDDLKRLNLVSSGAPIITNDTNAKPHVDPSPETQSVSKNINANCLIAPSAPSSSAYGMDTYLNYFQHYTNFN